MKALQENRRVSFSKKRSAHRPQQVFQAQTVRCPGKAGIKARLTQSEDSSTASVSSFKETRVPGCHRMSQKPCCCLASNQPSPAGTESAAYPRGAPLRSRKSRLQSYGSHQSLCSTRRCHGALPTPGHIFCSDNTKQRVAEPPPPSAWTGTEVPFA